MPETQADSLLPDADLVARTLAGDKTAFGTLVERYWPMAVALARTQARDAAHAEDIAQESFLRAYNHLAQLREPSRFAGWLSRIVAQQCADHRRRHKRNGSISLTQLTPAQEPASRAPDEPALTDRQRQSVRDAVGRLPAKLQQVVLMRFMADLSASAIAEQLGQRPGTIRVWLHRAYQHLRTRIVPILEDQEVEL